jgi:hypothetical protein
MKDKEKKMTIKNKVLGEFYESKVGYGVIAIIGVLLIPFVIGIPLLIWGMFDLIKDAGSVIVTTTNIRVKNSKGEASFPVKNISAVVATGSGTGIMLNSGATVELPKVTNHTQMVTAIDNAIYGQ